MCIVSSPACTSHQLWKFQHLKNNELSKPQILTISKCVSNIVLKFPLEVILRTRNFGNLLLAILLFVMVFRESPSTWSLVTTLDNLVASIPLPASQTEALDIEILLSSQGSRIVSMEKLSIAFSSQSVLITFKSSEANKEVPLGSIEAFGYDSLCCYRVRKAKYTELFSFFSPSRPILLTVEPRHHQCSDRMTPWHRSAIDFRNQIHDDETAQADHCRAPRRLHQIPGWLNDRYRPAAVIKGNPLPRTSDAKAPFPSELGTITILVLPPASLGHIVNRASLSSIPLLAEQTVLPSSSPMSRRSSE
jgi:hypothetical protein